MEDETEVGEEADRIHPLQGPKVLQTLIPGRTMRMRPKRCLQNHHRFSIRHKAPGKKMVHGCLIIKSQRAILSTITGQGAHLPHQGFVHQEVDGIVKRESRKTANSFGIPGGHADETERRRG